MGAERAVCSGLYSDPRGGRVGRRQSLKPSELWWTGQKHNTPLFINLSLKQLSKVVFMAVFLILF